MSGATTDGASAAFCADLVRTHDFESYAAAIFAPVSCRRALLALYAFNVEIVRVREHVTQPLPGEIRMQWWTDMLAGAGHGSVEANPVATELLTAIRDHGLPVDPLTRLIEAHQFDLYNDPMPDMAALEQYLDDTSCTLLSLAARIAGHQSDETDHLVHHAGLACGIARASAAFGRDASRRQLLVPRDLLERHGCDFEQIFAGQESPQLRAALGELAEDAQSHLDTALALLPGTPQAARAMFLPLALVRPALDRMVRPGASPFMPPAISRLRTLWTLWRAARSKAFRA
jgi:phytoene synthase